ncbi:hypothetical protein D0Z07_3871 [Hyphodiscus hymeniophilus]|uniref:NmrA-like domain-containing protein n=1 Tax=Hyphodiscus hymeniophilus TaxID=353542 RepID=A0A9P6VM07_9HELO|nr:hypothetical protein D0Z07_3871 [Hyphodiscus hymeniophilus]
MSISILLIGAGGALGQPLLQELIRQKDAFKAIGILATSSEKAEKFAWVKAKEIKVIEGSFFDPKSYESFTHVVSAVGNALMGQQSKMIDAAIAGGVTHFYPSEWNSDISQKEISGMRYFQDKQLTRSHLAAKAKDHPNFTYTLFITGIFTEWTFLEFYGFDHEKLEVYAYGTPDAHVGMTSIPDIAHYTISSLLLPFEANGPSRSERTIRVQATKTTFQKLVDALGAAKGVKYKSHYLPIEKAVEKQKQAKENGDELGEVMWSIRPLVASGFGIADGAAGSKLDNDLFDFVPETMEETFTRLFR